jgi:hypothetical protein
MMPPKTLFYLLPVPIGRWITRRKLRRLLPILQRKFSREEAIQILRELILKGEVGKTANGLLGRRRRVLPFSNLL